MPRCATRLPWGYEEVAPQDHHPSLDQQQLQYANLPAALLGALKRDKKPFTYTPGGVNLSEVLEARMQKRMERKKKYREQEAEQEQEQQSHQRLLVISPTYNSPLNMYSMENALETLEVQAEMAASNSCPPPLSSATLPRNYKFKFREEVEPSQSKAFRVLQVMTEPHSGDKRPKESTATAMRFTGLREGRPTNPSKFFHALQRMTDTEEAEEEEERRKMSIKFEKQSHVQPPQPQYRPQPPAPPKLKRPAAFLPKQQLWSYGRMPVGTDF